MMTPHRPGEQKRYPATADNDLRYLLSLPPAFDASSAKRWPVLVFLHGGGEAARNKTGQEQPIEALFNHGSPAWHCEIGSPLTRDFIVLSPQLPDRRKWEEPDLEKVERILRTIYTDFRGDPDRTLLTGFSYGAKAVFDFALWAEDLARKDASRKLSWAALWPIDEANDQARAACPVQRVWLSFGTWKPDLQRGTAANLGLLAAEAFRKEYPMADRLSTDYTSFGYDHVATCAVSYADWRVYDWLLKA